MLRSRRDSMLKKYAALIFFDSLVCNYPKVPIFALTPIWRSDYDGERIFGKFEDVENNIRKICSAHKNITVISA